MKKIAVLLAAFNGERWLNEQINSILNQRGVDITIFISVDYSDDNSFELCSDLSKKNNKIQVLSYGERFGGAGKNFFRLICDVNLDDFDYVSFSDQDDIWLDDKLYRACLILDKYDVYSSNVIAFWPTGKKILINKAQPQVEFDYLFESAGPGCTFVFDIKCAKMFRAFLEDKHKEVELVALHDWLFYAFARANDFSWYIDSKPSMLYRQHANNQVGANNSLKAIFKRLKLIKSKWYSNQINKIADLLYDTDIPFRYYLKSNNYFKKLNLLRYITKLRRKTKDKILLCIVIILGLF
uniref:glycosyltransferase n=1 Tax=Hafnia alvei TaxID=569 RepID=UPI00266D4BA2|nr:glycosyltransferase [Hafnia alvei]